MQKKKKNKSRDSLGTVGKKKTLTFLSELVIEDLPEESLSEKNTATFRILDNFSHHEYVDIEPPQRAARQAAREWKSLQEGLLHEGEEQGDQQQQQSGGGIYVVGCNKQVNLMKALIIGPAEVLFFLPRALFLRLFIIITRFIYLFCFTCTLKKKSRTYQI